MANHPKPLMMLVNPSAGRSMAAPLLGGAVGAFCEAGYAPTVFYTDAPGSAAALTEAYAPLYPSMVCLGGDGTLSDVISGLMRLPEEKRPHLGYIPMGTANDVANTLDLPMRQPQRAAERILKGSPLDYDVGEIVGVGYFSYVAAFGAFTEVSYKTDQDLKKALGHLAYVIAAVSSLPSIRSFHARVRHDGGEAEGSYIYGAVSNALSVGGVMKMDPTLVDLSDGKFEILLVSEPHGAAELNSIVAGIMTRDYSSSPCLQVIQSREVTISFDKPVSWTRDGEDGGSYAELTLRCHPHGVRIFC